MKWFRFYADALNNPKIQGLDSELFKFWVNVLCVTSQCDGVLPNYEKISFYLRLDTERVNDMMSQLIEYKLIEGGKKLKPHNWEKSQYKSDTSADRTKKYRAKKNTICDENGDGDCDVTCDVTETPSDSDSDSEKENNNPNGLLQKKIKRARQLPDDFSVTDHHRELAAKNFWPTPDSELEAFRDHHVSKGNRMLDWNRAFHTWLRNAKKFNRGFVNGKNCERDQKQFKSKTDMLNAVCQPGAFAGRQDTEETNIESN